MTETELPATVPRIEIAHELWRRGELSYKLHPTQLKIDQAVRLSQADEILILSARQLGKSFWAVVFAIVWCLKHPNCIVRILAPTLKQVQDIVADNLGPLCLDAPEGLVERHKSDYRWRIGTSSLRLGALERANVDNNRGGNAEIIICEEGGFVPSDDYDYAVKSVIGPQLLRSGGRLIHVTSPSQDPNHIIHTEIMPKCELQDTCFRYTIYDNPQITDEQIEKAKALCGGEKSAAWLREYMAQIIRDSDTVVVPHFDRTRHVKHLSLPESYLLHTVIDWGGVRDKTVALSFTYDFIRNKRLWLDERVYDANTSTEEIVAGCREMEAGRPVYKRIVDCPGQLQVDLARAHDFTISSPIKDDWQAGINGLQLSFTRDENEIDPKCKFLIQTLDSGRFNKNRTDFERTATLGHCDAIAAIMYGVRGTDTSNPFPHLTHHQTRFERHKVAEPMTEVAQAIQPRVFANDFDGSFKVKRFGTFKKR